MVFVKAFQSMVGLLLIRYVLLPEVLKEWVAVPLSCAGLGMPPYPIPHNPREVVLLRRELCNNYN
jgi:hypothetical protein